MPWDQTHQLHREQQQGRWVEVGTEEVVDRIADWVDRLVGRRRELHTVLVGLKSAVALLRSCE